VAVLEILKKVGIPATELANNRRLLDDFSAWREGMVGDFGAILMHELE
jgi:hypothetical protein